MNKFKKISAILILVILIAAICLFAGCDDGRAQSAEASLDFDGLGSAPTAEAAAKATPIDKSRLTLSDTISTDKAVLDSIKYILVTSNQNLIDCDFFAAASYGSGVATINGGTIVGAMDTRDVRVYDNGEYWYDAYGLIVDAYSLKKGKRGKVNSAVSSVISSALNYAKRAYSPDGETFYVSNKGGTSKSTITLFPSYNAVTYNRPKSQKQTLEQFNKYTYSRDSYKSYTTDNYDNDLPILSGSLKYDETNGIYTLEFDVNCENNTLELSVADMLSNSAIKKFVYAKKHLIIELWECGLIKNYINSNVWKAEMILNISGSSDNFYEQRFTYDKSKLVEMNIPQELKDKMKET